MWSQQQLCPPCLQQCLQLQQQRRRKQPLLPQQQRQHQRLLGSSHKLLPAAAAVPLLVPVQLPRPTNGTGTSSCSRLCHQARSRPSTGQAWTSSCCCCTGWDILLRQKHPAARVLLQHHQAAHLQLHTLLHLQQWCQPQRQQQQQQQQQQCLLRRWQTKAC
jgi:hypothetical protein